MLHFGLQLPILQISLAYFFSISILLAKLNEFCIQVSVGVVYDDQSDSFDIPLDGADIDSTQVF